MTQLHAATFATPCGPFSVAVNAFGAVVATAFGELPCLRARLSEKCHLLGEIPELTASVQREVEEYFLGNRQEFTVALAALGSAFQPRVWAELA
jgi:methylated-DNA-[protein]-cysteine S-methyltransferase